MSMLLPKCNFRLPIKLWKWWSSSVGPDSLLNFHETYVEYGCPLQVTKWNLLPSTSNSCLSYCEVCFLFSSFMTFAVVNVNFTLCSSQRQTFVCRCPTEATPEWDWTHHQNLRRWDGGGPDREHTRWTRPLPILREGTQCMFTCWIISYPQKVRKEKNS